MSELKYQLMLNKDMSWVPCYIKSEADKVIAEMDKELRHQKYKRCLDKAAKYLWKRNYWRDSIPAYERQHQWENMAYKHYKRWLELAEKFKEVE